MHINNYLDNFMTGPFHRFGEWLSLMKNLWSRRVIKNILYFGPLTMPILRFMTFLFLRTYSPALIQLTYDMKYSAPNTVVSQVRNHSVHLFILQSKNVLYQWQNDKY